MKKIFVFLVSVLMIILQVTLMSRFKFFGLNYGFALTSVIVVSCIYDTKTAIINSIVCGIVFDTYVSTHYGTYLAIFFIVALITMFISEFMYKGSLVTTIVITLILTILSELLMYYIFIVPQGMAYHSFALTKIIIPQALINSFITIIVFGIYKWLYNKLGLNKKW